MSKQIEYQIHRFLTEFGEAELAADQILRAAEKQSLARLDVQALSAFLFTAGFHKALISFLEKCLEKDRPLPWQYLAELTRVAPNITPGYLSAMVEGADANREIESLAYSQALDEFDPKLPAIRIKVRNQELQNYQKERQNILDQIRVFRHQNNLELELNLILKLQRLFPKDPEVSKQYTLYLERKARAYLEKRKNKLSMVFVEPEPFDLEISGFLFQQCLEQVAQNPESTLDYAMLFVFIGDHSSALKLAEKAPESASRNWLIAELMILCEKFAEALDWIILLETRYANESETPFAVSYLRALAYHGLGQPETALAVLEGLIQIRPGYRLSETLYQQWSEELT